MSDKPRDSGFASERGSAGPSGFGAGLGAWKDVLLGSRREPEPEKSDDNTDSDDSSSDSSIERLENNSEETSEEEEEEEMAPTTAIDLDKYSGLPKGSKFATGGGERTEQYEVRDWCRRVETIGSSVNWSEEVTASHAALALIPGTPAENWLRLEQKEGRLGTWPQFKQRIIARFSPPVTATQRVAMIRAMKQERSERVEDFKNRLQIQFEVLEDGVKQHVSSKHGQLDDQAGKPKLEAVNTAMEYVLQCLFLAGLQDRFVVDITKSGTKSLDEMVEVAKRTEEAATANTTRIAAIGYDQETSQQEEQPLTRTEMMQMIAAMSRGAEGGQRRPESQAKQKKSSATSNSKICCYYCFGKGHTTRACKALTADRRAGIHRPTIKCQPMTRAEFNALSYEEKTKGKHMIGESAGEEAPRVSSIQRQEQGRRPTQEDLWLGYASGN